VGGEVGRDEARGAEADDHEVIAPTGHATTLPPAEGGGQRTWKKLNENMEQLTDLLNRLMTSLDGLNEGVDSLQQAAIGLTGSDGNLVEPAERTKR